MTKRAILPQGDGVTNETELRPSAASKLPGGGCDSHTGAISGDGTIGAGHIPASPQHVSADAILARPRYLGGSWHSTRLHWTDQEKTALRTLVEANADLEKSADALGRSPTSIAHRARDTGLILPPAWAALIKPKRAPRLIVTEPKITLAYPFIIKKRDEHADLMAVNDLVPRYLPGREDVCQEIMLALWEGKITIDQLRANRANIRAFVRDFAKANYEGGGYALSLDMARGPDNDTRLIDTIADEPDRLWTEH